MTVKRPLEDDSEIEDMAMASCLMLLSRVGKSDSASESDWLFRCKTCNKLFQSFQALGGGGALRKLQTAESERPSKTERPSEKVLTRR
ncbi:hypothetical protein Hanom_Chr14g01278771 [Helianthus anomalus]